MPKIKPTSILPYTGQVILPNKEQNSINISNALSSTSPPKKEPAADFFGTVSAAAAYKQHRKNQLDTYSANLKVDGSQGSGHHLGSVLFAWKNRKMP